MRGDLGILRARGGGPSIIVHGGEASRAYRNVLEALDAALAAGVEMFEFDVRRTADGRLVVHHEDAIGEMLLSRLTRDEAITLARRAGYPLPDLEDILQRARGRLRLDVELKEAGYEAVVLSALSSAGFGPDDLVVTSFERSAIDAVHDADPAVTTGLLVYEMSGREALDMFRRSGAAFLGPDYTILDAATLERARREVIPLVPWTVNDGADIDRLLRTAAVAGVITDRPADAMTIRRRLSAEANGRP